MEVERIQMKAIYLVTEIALRYQYQHLVQVGSVPDCFTALTLTNQHLNQNQLQYCIK